MNGNIACNGRIPVSMFDLHWRVSKFNKAGFYIKKYFDNYNKALATKKK